ncbi:MAG: hypothetical protein Q7T55_22315 [Solirubrobacteraceae bacterium]|nr:hypothetical protein [Solirubrobacteraceae bacterium]
MTSTSRILPAILGFAFVAVTFAENLGLAILCLVGAAIFHLVAALYRGDVSLEDLQDRAEAARSGFNSPDRTPIR